MRKRDRFRPYKVLQSKKRLSDLRSSCPQKGSLGLVGVGQPQIHVATGRGHHEEGGVELYASDWSDVAAIEHAYLLTNVY